MSVYTLDIQRERLGRKPYDAALYSCNTVEESVPMMSETAWRETFQPYRNSFQL